MLKIIYKIPISLWGSGCRNLPKSVFLIFLAIFFMLAAWGNTASEKTIIFFYSSEVNINYFNTIKVEFDKYLSKFGAYEFQPFDNSTTFEQHIKDQGNSLILLSSWHFRKIYKANSLTSLLVGVSKGKNYQKRILVTTEKYADNNSFMKGTVASSSSIEHTRSVLNEMNNIKEVADIIRIITVPKDIDAIMAVGYDMAKSALTTENALDKLKTLDPVLPKRLKRVGEGKESLMLILAVPEKFSKNVENLVNVIQNMPNDPEGKNIISILNLDGWQKIEPADKAKLEG